MKRGTRRILLLLGTILVGGILAGTAAAQSQGGSFRIVRPVAAPSGCLEGARGGVAIRSFGPVEVMTVSVDNLPPNTKFNLFILQLPKEPFGIAWYEGDIETNAQGYGKGVLYRSLQPGDVRDSPRERPGAGSSRGRSLPGRLDQSEVRSHPHLPPGAVLRLARSRPAGWLPQYGDAVQRKAQGRDQSPLHPQVPRRTGARCDAASRHENRRIGVSRTSALSASFSLALGDR